MRYFCAMKNVLITGGTGGIGYAIAQAFAQLGYHIALNGIEANGAELAQDLATKYNVKTWFSNANLLDTSAVEKMCADAAVAIGSIDILVNNAGIQFVSPLQDFPLEKWQQIIQINLTSAFICSKAVWPGMLAKKHGRVINIASAHGLVASAYKSAYVAAKHGMIGFTKTLALEGGEHGITCNAICPGYVYTPIVEKQIPEQMAAHGLTREEVIKDVFLKKHAIKEFVSIDAVVQACMYLASDGAKFTTGIAMPVDAGWVAE
jgi:3-hydroxybutyrate dehydrogenase